MKWFTYCEAPANNNSRTTNTRMALLFGCDDNAEEVTEDDRDRVAQDPLLATLFPKGCHVYDVNKMGFLFTPKLSLLPLPDQVKMDEAIPWYREGKPHWMDFHQRYNDCRSLVKALGCQHCPEKDAECLAKLLPDAAPGTHTDAESVHADLEALLRHRQTSLGGFTFASPVMTKVNHFDEAYRGYSEHDFTQIPYWTNLRQENAKTSAASRKFKKNECGRCLLHGTCGRYRHCSGAVPTDEAVLLENILTHWRPRLAVWKDAEWKLWTLARAGGRESKIHRCASLFHGPKWDYYKEAWELLSYRAKVSIDRLAFHPTYEEVAHHYQLPLEKPPSYREPTDKEKALWCLTQEVTHRSRGGWGGSGQTVVYRELNHDEVYVRWAGGTYLDRTARMSEYIHLWTVFDQDLPGPRLPKLP